MTAPERLPPPLMQGGAVTPAEEAAANLLQTAFGEVSEPHPAVGERMWREIEPRLDHDHARAHWGRRRRWMGAGAIGALATVVLVWATVPSAEAPLRGELVHGRLLGVNDATHAGSSVSALERWSKGEPVRCASAFCELRTPGVRAVLTEEAVFSVDTPAGSPSQTTTVHRGAVSFSVEPLSPGETFAVRAGDTLVEVVGTAFRVEANQRTRVVVTEGTVRVTHRGVVNYVRAGELWNEPAPRQQAAATPPKHIHSLAAAAHNAAHSSPQPSAPATAEEAVQEEGASKASARTSSQKLTSPGGAVPQGEALPGGPSQTGSTSQERARAATQPEEALPNEAPVEDPSALVRRASALAEAGALDKAQAILRGLAVRSGPSGELGLYRLAQFQLRWLHAPQQAQATLGEMQARYPTGSLQVERHLTQIEAWLAQRRCAEAEQAQEAFLSRFSGSRSLLEDLRPMMEAAGCSR